jgi:hypothetical protein
MLNFAEQTGSGAVIVVWSFLHVKTLLTYLIGRTKLLFQRTLRFYELHTVPIYDK